MSPKIMKTSHKIQVSYNMSGKINVRKKFKNCQVGNFGYEEIKSIQSNKKTELEYYKYINVRLLVVWIPSRRLVQQIQAKAELE